MNKKAELSTAFNWIFVIVAGGVILALFFSVIQKQQAISEEKVSIQAVKKLDTLATRATQEKDTFEKIPLPRVGVTFSCDDLCNCQLGIGDQTQPFKEKIIFAPQEIRGSQLYYWTLPWETPFRVTNFVYMTGPLNTYYFIFPANTGNIYQQLKEQLRKDIPEDVNYKIKDINTISQEKNTGYQNAKFIFIDIINTEAQNAMRSSGRIDITFYDSQTRIYAAIWTTGTDKEDPKDDTILISDQIKSHASVNRDFKINALPTYAIRTTPELYAAIFSSSNDMLSCGLKNAYERLNYQTRIYEQRTTSMNSATQAHNAQGRMCLSTPGTTSQNGAYVQAKTVFNTMHTITGKIINDTNKNKGITSQNRNSLNTQEATLNTLNNKLELKTCPVLY